MAKLSESCLKNPGCFKSETVCVPVLVIVVFTTKSVMLTVSGVETRNMITGPASLRMPAYAEGSRKSDAENSSNNFMTRAGGDSWAILVMRREQLVSHMSNNPLRL